MEWLTLAIPGDLVSLRNPPLRDHNIRLAQR
jgi:hypothetical protein